MKRVLIVGMGSIGRRHAKNLQTLGCEIGSVDPRSERHTEAEIDGIRITQRFHQMTDVNLSQWDGIVLATPPAYHIEQLQEVWAQVGAKPILMEKNLCLDYDEIPNRLEMNAAASPDVVKVLMGYTWRWWRSIQQLRVLLPQIGALLRAEFTMAAHLADWHPWERIEDFYAAERGGVLNEAHWHDVMLMLFGFPRHVYASYRHISMLPTTTPDVLDMIADYDTFHVNLHYDLFKRPHERSARFTGERGTLEWTPNEIRIGHFKDPEWRVFKNTEDRNSMFMAMAKDFVYLMDYGAPIKPTCTLQDGINVMRLLKACERSNRSRQRVAMEDIL